VAGERQIGPPVTIDGWLIRVISDNDSPDVLAKATKVDDPEHEVIVTPYGIAVRTVKILPSKVLEALLKIGGWKAVRP